MRPVLWHWADQRIVSVGLERDPLAHHEAGGSFEHLDGVDASSSGHGAGLGRHSGVDLPGAIRHKPVTVEDCAVADRLCSGRGAVGPKALRRTLAAGCTLVEQVAWGEAFDDISATISWRGMGLAESSGGRAVAFGQR